MYTLLVKKSKEVWFHQGFQKYFQGIGWMFFTKIAGMVISFLTTAYIARNLGPTNYGELSYAISFVSIFSFISVLGIDQVLYRDIVKFPENKNQYLGSALILRLSASLVAILLCISFAFLISPKDVSLLLIFLLSITFIFNSFQIISYEFQADVKSKHISIFAILVTLILNVLKIIVIANNKGVLYLAGVLVLESIFYMFGFLYFRTKIYGTIRTWEFNKTITKNMVKDSWPFMFTSAFALIYSRIDQVIIKNMIGASSVGLYDAAVRLSEVWYFIPTIISSTLFPAIMNAKKVSTQIFHERLKRLALLLLVVSIIIALPTTLFSYFIVTTVFGVAFAGSTTILQVYIWSNLFTSLTSVINYYLIAENLKKTLFFSAFAGMIANILLNIYLIPIYGILGAAYATLISYAIPCIGAFVKPKSKNHVVQN